MRFFLKLILTTLTITIISAGCSSKTQPDSANNNTEETLSIEENTIQNSDTKNNVSDEDSNTTEVDPIIDLINIINDDSYTVLVNKFNSLSEGYIPDDLVTVSVPTILENPEVNQLREVADNALTSMFSAAEEENLFLFARSGFRSFNTQVHLFNGYAEKHGEEAANTYSAKPGFSEHQTGLVMDVTSESVQFQLTEQFGSTAEGKWIAENAHKFGFIIRYPYGKEEITGYVYEPWHLRYLGKEVAEAVYNSNVTYEEFLVEKGIIDDVQFEKK